MQYAPTPFHYFSLLLKKNPLNQPIFIQILLFITGIVSVAYLLLLLCSIPFRKTLPEAIPSEGVTVLIAAHNERENLGQFLPSVLNQSYPLFEIIVVCDRCTDGTVSYLKSLSNKNLRIIEVNGETQGVHPKKAALQTGIKAARYDWILLTDADCRAASHGWISGMMAAKEHKAICLGISMYEKRPGFLNAFIQFETLFTAFQYTGWAILGKPYMAVGRNLLYSKQLFINTGGFGKYGGHLGGDDDLLIQRLATGRNTTVCINTESFTLSRPAEGFSVWWRQKHRHLHAGKKYPIGVLINLCIYPVCSTIFYAGIIYSGISLNFAEIMLFYILRTCIFISIFVCMGRKWNVPVSIFFLPIAEIVYLIYLLFAGLYNTAVPIKKWK